MILNWVLSCFIHWNKFRDKDKKTTAKSKSSSSDSDEISDEEEDLKNYLKRRESRKYFNF